MKSDAIDLDALEAARIEASVGLQQVQDLVGYAEIEQARVRFPRGYLRSSAEGRRLFPFVRRPVLQKNLGYAAHLADVYTWILTRTDLAAIAQDMVVKAYLALAGGIAEAVLTNHFHGQTGWRQHFASRTQRLVEEGTIDPELGVELLWLWEMRCRQHVFEITDSEFDAYSSSDFPRARRAVNRLLMALARAAGTEILVRAL